ncbi:MAG: hypothetical protein MSG64_12070 [Pyrinomonadaceae bacterium MAG19_C2-C3]|nr:hypothetical protein [Pyrinomonadaceae bacterium MAG19_C2-C3]
MLSLRLYSTAGTLCSEDRQIHNVARSRVQSMHLQLQRKYDSLASQSAVKNSNDFRFDVGEIVARVRSHSWLKDDFTTLDNYTDNFPELKSFVDGKLAHIESQTRHNLVQQTNRIVH